MTGDIYWIWFQLVFGIGTWRAELFLEYFESPREIFEGAEANGRVTGMLDTGELDASAAAMERAAEIERRTLRKGCSILTPEHPHYPKLLLGIYSRPAALYVKGDMGCLDGTLAIAMVGTRNHTEYGGQAAAELAGGLARAGAVVVSGLAPGIDTECHRAALAAGGKTVGVLGCGLDVDYPKPSREIKTAASQNGAVITEYPLGAQPRPENFPLRNRIISGMSHGTVVVEADLHSGSLITARFAREQGREVFAVPGSIFARGGQGAHQLIKEGARLAETAGDILAQYPRLVRRGLTPEQPVLVGASTKPVPDEAPSGRREAGSVDPVGTVGPEQMPKDIGEAAALVYARFGPETLTVDDLVSETGMRAGELMSALTELELYGLITCRPGRRFGRASGK